MSGAVFSLGSILVDLTVDVPTLPERGGDVLATATRTLPGGGFNLAVAVARQGVRCVYAAGHGTGRHGDLVRAALAAASVETLLPPRPGADTGFCVVMLEPGGERTFVTMPGAEAVLTAADLAAVRPGPDDIVAVSGYDLVYPGSGPALAAWLPDAGVRLALDPGPLIMDIPRLPPVAVLTMNQREARLLSGRPAAHGTNLLAAVTTALDRITAGGSATAPGRPAAGGRPPWPGRATTGERPAWPGLVVVREGADGCVATGGPLGDRVVTVPAPTVRAVDTTGAGDTHTGVLLAALTAGRTVDDALRLANRAAAIAVTRVGPATAPTAAQLHGDATAE